MTFAGVLLAIFFTAAAESLAASGERDVWAALRHGVARMQLYGGAQLGHRTVLDAMIPALQCSTLAGAHAAAVAGADATATMGAALSGRSAYVNASSLVGVRDPGAVAFAAALDALLDDKL